MFSICERIKQSKKVPLLFNDLNNVLLNPVMKKSKKVKTHYDVFKIFWDNWNKTLNEREECMVLYLHFCKKSKKTHVLGISLEGVGDKESVEVPIHRTIERAKLVNGNAIAIAHNHTNYNSRPSAADLNFYLKVKELMIKNKLQFVENVILTPQKKKYFSFVKARIL